jgi:hypothetical protein
MHNYSTKIVSSEWRLHGTRFGDLAKSFTPLSHSILFAPLTPNQRLALSTSAPNPTRQWVELPGPGKSPPLSQSSGGHVGFDRKEETKPAAPPAPSSTPLTPLCTAVKSQGLQYPYAALSRRSDRRPAARGCAPHSKPTRTRTPLPFTYMTRHITRTPTMLTTLPRDYHTARKCCRTPTGTKLNTYLETVPGSCACPFYFC